MSEFELLVIPIGLVLGLGVTQVLGDTTEAVRGRAGCPLHWIPLAWAFLIFLFQVHYFFVIWDLNEHLIREGKTWTARWFWPSFFHAGLMFLGAGLILPTRRVGSPDLISDFDTNGRLALVPLGLGLFAAIPLNVLVLGDVWLSVPNLLNAILLALIVVTLGTRRRATQAAATVLFGLVQICGMLFVWSQPGTS